MDDDVLRILRTLVDRGLLSQEEWESLMSRRGDPGWAASVVTTLQSLIQSAKAEEQTQLQEEVLSADTVRLGKAPEKGERLPVVLPARFQDPLCLGEGGMGTVFKAFDTLLQRWVAIKVLRRASPGLKNLLTEARSQAQVEHPHVCPIYEVDDSPELPLIVMRYVPGVTLAQLAGQLTPKQVAKLGAQLASALHAAHERKLLHRDLKPANVLVERIDDELHPFLVDFGLSQVEEGEVVGTPAFMAPEVAQGLKATELSDVYSLGATLFTALVGQPPIAGNLWEVISTLSDPAWKPPSLPPHVPEDLALIVAKALQPNPANRYPTAKALAEDLERFLTGLPVIAHAPSRWYAFKKYFLRHAVTYLLSGVAFATALGSVAYILWSVHQTKKQQAVHGFLWNSVVDIENQWRALLTQDSHNISQERKRLLARLHQCEQVARDEGLKESALLLLHGKAFMNFGEYRKARKALELAQSLGLETPELREALGLTLLHLWLQETEAAHKIPNPELREAKEKELQRTLRDPARQLLKSLPMEPSAHFFAAKLALAEDNHAEALKQAKAAAQGATWRYEVEELLGDIHRARAAARANQGQYHEAWEALDQALEHYRRAANLAPSYAPAWLGQASVYLGKAEVAVETGQSPLEWWSQAQSSAEHAGTVDPENLQAWETLAILALRQMDYRVRRGQDPTPPYTLLERATGQLFSLEPEHAPALAFKAIGLRLLSLGAPSSQEAIRLSEAALEHLNRAVARDPSNTLAANNVGLLYYENGFRALRQGQDPLLYFDRAAQAFQKVLDHAPRAQAVLDNLGATYLAIASLQLFSGEEASAYVSRAATVLHQALANNPQDTVALTNLAYCALLGATEKLWKGDTSFSELDVAHDFLEKVRALNPQEPTLLANSLRWYLLQLWRSQRLGHDPRGFFHDVKRLAPAISPSDAESLGLWAAAQLVQAQSSPPQEKYRLLQSAAQALGQALAQAPVEPELLLWAGELAVCSHQRLAPKGVGVPELIGRLRRWTRFPVHQALATFLENGGSPSWETLPSGLKEDFSRCRQ